MFAQILLTHAWLSTRMSPKEPTHLASRQCPPQSSCVDLHRVPVHAGHHRFESTSLPESLSNVVAQQNSGLVPHFHKKCVSKTRRTGESILVTATTPNHLNQRVPHQTRCSGHPYINFPRPCRWRMGHRTTDYPRASSRPSATLWECISFTMSQHLLRDGVLRMEVNSLQTTGSIRSKRDHRTIEFVKTRVRDECLLPQLAFQCSTNTVGLSTPGWALDPVLRRIHRTRHEETCTSSRDLNVSNANAEVHGNTLSGKLNLSQHETVSMRDASMPKKAEK